jgi:ATP-dependent DNA helicase RecQ
MPEAMGRQLELIIVEPSKHQKKKQRRRSSSSGATGATYDTTLALIKEGLHYDEIAEKRGLKTSTITSHFIKLAGRGEEFDVSRYLDGDILARLRTLTEDWEVGDALRPLKDELPDSCSYPSLKIHLAYILMERE